ncbi:hypothetical protein, partial [Psychrobacter faecalis]|uniref:hypothetical protein n=1 Tax=Psychrobacter faecalis TaxID=180588 RepID=UPI0028A5D39A
VVIGAFTLTVARLVCFRWAIWFNAIVFMMNSFVRLVMVEYCLLKRRHKKTTLKGVAGCVVRF